MLLFVIFFKKEYFVVFPSPDLRLRGVFSDSAFGALLRTPSLSLITAPTSGARSIYFISFCFCFCTSLHVLVDSLTGCQSRISLVWHSNIACHSSRQHGNLFSPVSGASQRVAVNSKRCQSFPPLLLFHFLHFTLPYCIRCRYTTCLLSYLPQSSVLRAPFSMHMCLFNVACFLTCQNIFMFVSGTTEP